MNQSMANALKRVSCLEGVSAVHNPDDDLAILGGRFDDYLLVGYLGELLERGELTFEVNPSERMGYIKKLLKMEK